MSLEFNLKTKLKFGTEEALSLGKYIKELNFKRIAVIVDSGVFNLDYIKQVLDSIEEPVKVWEYDLKAEPDYDSLDRIKLEFLSYMPDCFVGIGGGSVIDFAKGLATIVKNPGKAIEYRGFPIDINIPVPVIAVPTTAGTGSEVTYNAVFVDLEEKKKLGINTMHNFPVLAILDPKLTLSCPKSVIVSAGMDALTHTLESYAAVQANSLTRVFSKQAFKLIFNNLFRVLDDSENLKIRADLQLGAYLAGISLMNSGSGPAGALSYILGANFKAPHGLAGAVFLPYIVEHNIKHGYNYSELTEALSGKLFELCRKLEVPSSLRDFGVNQENINILLKETENLDKAFAQNPIPFSVEQGKLLIKELSS